MDAATGHASERVKDRRRRDTGLIVGIAVGAVALGLSVFAALAWRAVTIQRAGESEALQQFEAVRSRLPTTDPLVQRDRSGRLVKRNRSSRGEAPPRQLSVIAYYSSGERLVTAEVPLWFLRVKGPAVQFALRGTGFDLESLGLTADDLVRSGAGVVLDEMRDNGDRVLAWTE
jgi:hypothetical protein